VDLCKYEKWYWAFIDKFDERGWTRKTAPCYVEGHHPYPLGLFGKRENKWRVYVTPREHYVLHLLLCKFTELRMPMFWKNYTSREFSPARTIASRQNSGEKHPRYGKNHTEEVKEKLRNNPNMKSVAGKKSITNGNTQKFIFPGEPIPEGWTPGGVKESEETKEKKRRVDPAKRAVNKGRKFSQEWLDNLKKSHQSKPELTCPSCGKVCKGAAALGSHKRTHKKIDLHAPSFTYTLNDQFTATMNEFGRFRLIYEPGRPVDSRFDHSIEMAISGEADLTQLTSLFERFLQASGYVLDGKLFRIER